MGAFYDHCLELEGQKCEEGIQGFQPDADSVTRARLLDAGIDPVDAERVADMSARATLAHLGMSMKRDTMLYHIIKGSWADGVVTGATFER